MKKIKSTLLIFLAAIAILLCVPAQKTYAASYKCISTITEYYDKSERTVGDAVFSAKQKDYTQPFTFSVKIDGKKTSLTVMKGASPTIITNGNTIYYHKYTGHSEIIYKTTIKNTKPVKIREIPMDDEYTDIDFAGYYNGYIYYTKGIDPGYFYRINVKTGKYKKLANDVTTVKQNGGHFLLYPYLGDLSPYSARVYDAKEDKVTTICKKVIYTKLTSKYVYYAEVKEEIGYSEYKVSIKRANLDGSGKKTLLSSLKVAYVTDITSSYVKYEVKKSDSWDTVKKKKTFK